MTDLFKISDINARNIPENQHSVLGENLSLKIARSITGRNFERGSCMLRKVTASNVSTFEDRILEHLLKKQDFLFIPFTGDHKNPVYLDNKIQLYRIPYEIFANFEQTSVLPVKTISTKMRVFNRSNCELLWTEGDPPLVNYDPNFDSVTYTTTTTNDESEEYIPVTDDSNKPYTNFTMKDIACILLKTPNTERQWLNDLIRKRN